MNGKRIAPGVETIKRALRWCVTRGDACKDCYLYAYRGPDGLLSTGLPCSEHLHLDAIDLFNRMNQDLSSLTSELEQYWEIGTVEELTELVQAKESHKVYKLDGFYCYICNKNHMRIIDEEGVFFTRAEAEAALLGGQNNETNPI